MIVISRFSGKCDFYDHLDIYGALDGDEGFQKFKDTTTIYVGANDYRKLEFETLEDLIPYYTHIISLGFHNKETGSTITLSSKSWLEIEEERYYPSPHRIRLMKEFDEFVKSHGKEPIWKIPLVVREAWTPCPLGERYFCEPKLHNGKGSKFETRFCPYMYANRKMPCKKAVWEEKRKKRLQGATNN